jgi:hypothetical protein
MFKLKEKSEITNQTYQTTYCKSNSLFNLFDITIFPHKIVIPTFLIQTFPREDGRIVTVKLQCLEAHCKVH